jgi:hypothetical protein
LTFIFVDESGDVGLCGRRFFILSFICVEQPGPLSYFLERELRFIKQRNQYPRELNELKFKLPKDKLKKRFGYTDVQIKRFENQMVTIRRDVLNIINKFSDRIFTAILDKTTIREPTWTEERIINYIFGNSIQLYILNMLDSPDDPFLFYDSGRLNKLKENDFKQYLRNKDSYHKYKGFKNSNGVLWNINSVESHNEPCIWAADFIAGSYYDYYTFSNSSCTDLIDVNKFIGDGFKVYWE